MTIRIINVIYTSSTRANGLPPAACSEKKVSMKRHVIASLVLIGSLGTIVGASVGGAIYTSINDGSTVNANIYQDKAAVYLSGGPQNHHSAGLSPAGNYYFQVTDPSGAVLLSEDDITCRVVRVVDGRIAGIPADNAGGYGNPACYHVNGLPNADNSGLAVQLMPYADTPNNGGEYKAWLTPVAAFNTCDSKQSNHGFCESESKTDNFKVRTPSAANVSVCKFNDRNGDGEQNNGEPFIPHWPITANSASGVVTAQTGDNGCTSFTFTGFGASATQTVTLAEGSFGPDWTQTAPTSCSATANCQVTDGVITLQVRAGEVVSAPAFGNTNPYCDEDCVGDAVVVTATAYPSLSRTFGWQVEKSVDQTRIATAAGSATFNYTVTASHDAGTDSAWQVTGSIRVANPGSTPLTGLTISSLVDNGGTCTLAGAAPFAIAAGSHEDYSYTCTYPSAPVAGAVTVSANWAAGQASANAGINFADAAVNVIDGQASIDDSLAGALGTVNVTAAGPFTFTYAKTVTGIAGRCVTTNNVATIVAAGTGATTSASRAVELCVGADLGIAATAATSFASAIDKRVDHTLVQQQNGTATLNYTVKVTESNWKVAGAITITNPNDWQGVTVTADSLTAGGACVVSGTPVVVAASSSVTLPYSCTFVSAPAAASTLSSLVSWDAVAAATSSASAAVTSPFSFGALSVTDTFNGSTTALGTIATPAALTTYAYPRIVANATGGACRTYTNTATIAGGASASQTTTMCNTATGAHTIGFWQNKNGQSIITGSAADAGVCRVATWLRRLTPFQDLAATANCKTTAAYATTVIKAASAAGTAMNPMLKAQMLATALDVYFSDATLGGNALGAAAAVGSVRFDLTGVSAAFGGASSLTGLELLTFQNSVANSGGSVWYGNVKTVQELAKNTFDAINNEIAKLVP
jgi:hypothetical protein